MRKIWTGVKDLISLKSMKTQNPTSLSIDNTISSDPKTVANNFNDFFTSVADSVRSTVPPSNHHLLITIFLIFLKTVIQVLFFFSQSVQRKSLKLLGYFSVSKSNGPNNIPVIILKLICDEISFPISSS